MKIKNAEDGRVYIELSADLVESIGRENILRSEIQTNAQGHIVIVPFTDKKRLEATRKIAFELMQKYQYDLMLLKDDDQ